MSKVTIPRFAVFILAAIMCKSVTADETPSSPDETAPPAESALDLVSDLFGELVPTSADAIPESAATPQSAVIPALEGAASADASQQTPQKIEIQTNYAAAVREAQLSNRPLFVLLGARWCGWCRKLEAELEKPEADSIFTQWVVVTVDVEDEPEIASRLQAAALPGLRIVGPFESLVASREGYLELPELKQWLDANRKAADPALHRVLFETAPPDKPAIEQLIMLLAESSPSVRSAAAERLAAHPAASAAAMVSVLKTGRLIQQLSAWEVLHRWKAPLGAVDPWQPETLRGQSVTALEEWARTRIEAPDHLGGDADAIEDSAPPLDKKIMDDLLRRLIESEASQRASLINQLVVGGDHAATEVHSRLAIADQLDDDARESLRELLYNALASRQLRLQQPGVLTALSRLHADTHRQAAAAVLDSSAAGDQPLVDELAHDSDPLVRELAVRALGKLQLLTDSTRVQQLLGDSSPNVRTSVLRSLAEHPSEKALESLCAYLDQESDEDLLVHGAKCLAQLRGQPQAMAALAKLAASSSWRVRAAAIDATAHAIQNSSQDAGSPFSRPEKGLPDELTAAIVAAAFEEDAFVADRASKLLPSLINDKTVSAESIEQIAVALADHPDKLQSIADGIEEQSRGQTFAPLIRLANDWLKSNDRQQIERAVHILSPLAPAQLNERLAEVLSSPERSVRVAGLRAAIASAAEYRRQSIEAATGVWASYSEEAHPHRRPTITPWYDVPAVDTLKGNAVDESKAEVHSASNDMPADGNAIENPKDAIDLAGDFFTPEGAATATKQSDGAEQASVDDNSDGEANHQPQRVADTLDAVAGLFGNLFESERAAPSDGADAATDERAEMEVALPSRWMQRWHEDSTKNRPKWLAACEAPTRELLTSDDANERCWASAFWLVLGHTDRIDELLPLLDQIDGIIGSARGDGALRGGLVSWLPSELRLMDCQKQILLSHGDTEKIVELLIEATAVDDERVADWVFDFLLDENVSDPALRPALVRIVLRSRLGVAADQVNEHISAEHYRYSNEPPYEIVRSTQPIMIPGRIEACEWLRERFQESPNDRQRTIALLAVAKLDHQTAVNAAIRAIDEAKVEGELVQAALAIVLSDAPKSSARRATAMLSHHLPAVRLAAMRFLASPTPVRDKHAEPWVSSVPMFAEYSDLLPGLSWTTEPLPIEVLNELAQSENPEQKSQAKLLLIAAGQQHDVSELESELREQYGEFTRLCVAAALAKAGRTDDPSIRYYEDTFTHASDDRIPAALYGALRGLKGEKIIEVRRSMRRKKGADLFNTDTSAGFSVESDIFGF